MPDDQRAWSQLADARRALEAGRRSAGIAGPRMGGDAHRRGVGLVLVVAVTTIPPTTTWCSTSCSAVTSATSTGAIDVPAPEELFVSNITTQPPAAGVAPPSALIHPVIDGEMTNYFEWIGAGSVDIVPVGDAMHEVSARATAVSALEFGFDLENLYVRVAGPSPMRTSLPATSSSRSIS